MVPSSRSAPVRAVAPLATRLLLAGLVLSAGALPARAQLSQPPAGILGFYFDLEGRQNGWPMPPAAPAASGTQFKLYLLGVFNSGAPAGQQLWAWEAGVTFDPSIVVLRREIPGTDFASGDNDFCVGLGNAPAALAAGAPVLLASFDCLLLGAGVVNAVAAVLPQGGCVPGELEGPQWQGYPAGDLIPFANFGPALVNPELATWGAVKRRYEH